MGFYRMTLRNKDKLKSRTRTQVYLSYFEGGDNNLGIILNTKKYFHIIGYIMPIGVNCVKPGFHY